MDKGVKDFHNYILYDVLDGIPGITSKPMFGGYGFYLEGAIFGIITSESEIYFKVDADLKDRFRAYDSHPFVYTGHKNKGPVEMPYWLVPEEILEDKEAILQWVYDSADVSKRK